MVFPRRIVDYHNSGRGPKSRTRSPGRRRAGLRQRPAGRGRHREAGAGRGARRAFYSTGPCARRAPPLRTVGFFLIKKPMTYHIQLYDGAFDVTRGTEGRASMVARSGVLNCTRHSVDVNGVWSGELRGAGWRASRPGRPRPPLAVPAPFVTTTRTLPVRTSGERGVSAPGAGPRKVRALRLRGRFWCLPSVAPAALMSSATIMPACARRCEASKRAGGVLSPMEDT